MKKRNLAFSSFLALICLASLLALGSCAGFKLISQRPGAGSGAAVDANSAASSDADWSAEDAGAAGSEDSESEESETEADETYADEVTAATS